ncbi:hypothetical protein SDC9_98681 [bioreactor metagenome]|uniref:Uncharacterized protein n=1 Tax=bioreactor metagenome TaxID=1076179 RepID=A0A645AFG5_9ZZZZ
MFKGEDIQPKHLTEGELVGDVEVHALRLVDMPLAHTRRADGPGLVDLVRTLVVPEGIQREVRRNAGDQAVFLFLQEVAVHDGVDARRRARDDACAAGWRDGEEPAVSHTLPRHLFRELLPARGTIIPLVKIRARLPVAALKVGIAALIRGNIRACRNRGVVDPLKHRIDKLQVRLALPADAVLREHVMIAADPQPDRAIFEIVHLRIRHGEKVEVNDVIQRADHIARQRLQLFAAQVDLPQRETREVADHKVARLGGGDDDGLAVYADDLLTHVRNAAHVLRNLRAEIAAIDHALVVVRVCAVYRIPVEDKRRSGLDCALEDHAHELLDRNHALFDAAVGDAVAVARLPLLAPEVLQTISLHGGDVMRAHKIPAALMTSPP